MSSIVRFLMSIRPAQPAWKNSVFFIPEPDIYELERRFREVDAYNSTATQGLTLTLGAQ